MARTADAPKTKTYILKPNQEHHGFKDGERHVFIGSDPENNKVELNETQFKAFRDKFNSPEELKAQAFANSGEVSREDALRALGLTEDQVAGLVEPEETIKQPDPKAGEQQKAAGEGLDKEGKDPKEGDHPQKTDAGKAQTTGATAQTAASAAKK